MSPNWSVGSTSPGGQKFIPGDTIPYTLGSDAAVAGDAVTVSSASGELVLTDGSNGFVGILGTQTEAGAPGNHEAAGIASGSEVSVGIRGVRVAKVTAAVETVDSGQKLVPGANGALTNVDAGAGSPEQAGPGDLQALTAPNADGFSVVKL